MNNISKALFQYINIFAAMIISLVISSFLYQIIYPYKKVIPPAPKNQSWNIILNQTEDEKLTLKSMTVIPLPPSNYQLNLTRDYYQVTMIDEKGKQLFTGKIINKSIAPPPDIPASQRPGNIAGITVKFLNTLNLFLPYYKNTKQILFQDQKGITKLQIDRQVTQ